jgi:hypothetical protein
MTVAIPAPLVAAGAGLPRVCARHGEPATRHRRVLFRSATPWWVYLLLPLGLLPFAIVAVVLQKQVKTPQWPFCPRCGRLRGRRAVAGLGFCMLAVAAVVALAGVVPAEYAIAAVLVFVALLVAGIGLVAQAGPAWIARGTTARDGATVEFRHAHPAFADQVEGVRQQWARQQQYWETQQLL